MSIVEDQPTTQPDPGTPPPKRRRRLVDPYLRDRVLAPLAIIAVSGFAVVIIILDISRLFLGTENKHGAVALCAAVASVGFLTAVWAAYQTRLPNSQALAIIAGVVILLSVSGWALLDRASDTGEVAVVPAVSDVTVTAHNFGFNLQGEAAVNATAPAIIFDFSSTQGSHTFVIEGHEDEMALAASETSGVDEGRISLPVGSYTYYCDIPGHRQNGMEGTLDVRTAPDDAPVVGESGSTDTTAAA